MSYDGVAYRALSAAQLAELDADIRAVLAGDHGLPSQGPRPRAVTDDDREWSSLVAQGPPR
jgi:hypothetical protein